MKDINRFLENNVKMLPMGAGKEGDYRIYYFEVTASNKGDKRTFALTFSETVFTTWKLDDLKINSFAPLLINYILLSDPNLRNYLVTSYDWFYNLSFEISFDTLKTKYIVELEEPYNVELEKLIRIYTDKVRHYFNELELLDIGYKCYEDENRELLLVCKNLVTNLKFHSESDMTQFLICVVNTFNLWDLSAIANYIPNESTKIIIKDAQSLLNKAEPMRHIAEMNNLNKIKYVHSENSNIANAVSVLMAVNTLRNKNSHIKASEYLKKRKVLGLKRNPPKNTLDRIVEACVILDRATQAVEDIRRELGLTSLV